MKDILNSIILYEMIFLFWMAATMGNRVFNFANLDSPSLAAEQTLTPTRP